MRRPQNDKRPLRCAGFSLIELLVVLSIAAILLMLASNFAPLLDQSRSRQVSDSLRAHIAQTRSESISRGGNVRLCGSSDGASCAASLNRGWIIYYDGDNNGALDPADSILSRFEQSSARLSIDSTNGSGTAVSSLGFDYRGFPSEALTLAVSSGVYSNTVQLFANGRIALQ